MRRRARADTKRRGGVVGDAKRAVGLDGAVEHALEHGGGVELDQRNRRSAPRRHPLRRSPAACEHQQSGGWISARLSAIQCCTTCREPERLPGASSAGRGAAAHQVEARSQMPIQRMQWWMRPGPSRSCAIAKPAPPRRGGSSTGTRRLVRRTSAWLAQSSRLAHHGDVPDQFEPRRVGGHQDLAGARRGAWRPDWSRP